MTRLQRALAAPRPGETTQGGRLYSARPLGAVGSAPRGRGRAHDKRRLAGHLPPDEAHRGASCGALDNIYAVGICRWTARCAAACWRARLSAGRVREHGRCAAPRAAASFGGLNVK